MKIIEDHLKEDAEISEGIDDIMTEVEAVARRKRNIDAVIPREERNDQSLEGDHTPRHHHLLPHPITRRRRDDESQSILSTPSIRRRESIDIVMNDTAMKVTVTAMMQQSKNQH